MDLFKVLDKKEKKIEEFLKNSIFNNMKICGELEKYLDLCNNFYFICDILERRSIL
jgi:hypothetical protein